jgi:adenine-specific DNA-methyltransferase
MMYPRLMLLYKLLSPAGVIFISIDDNEFNYLSLLLEEIFGKKNMVETMIWKKSYGGGSKSKHIVNLHEYIFFCAKNIDLLPPLSLPPDESLLKYYKFTDEKLEQRGPYRLQTLATTSMDERPNLRYAIPYEGEEIWPAKQWQWSKDRALEALANNELVIEKKKKKWSVNYKQYLKSTEGEGRGKKLYSIIDGIYTQQGTSELKQIFPDSSFTFPKPVGLIRTLLTLVTNKNSIILDSFAGSGTTAQAVLNLNKADGGERKFILIETEDYAESITAERVKRVIRGNDSMPGTGGAFDYFVLGERVFDEEGDLNAKIPLEMLKRYIWYTETNTAYIPPKKEFHESFLGKKDGVAYFFNFKHEEETILDRKFLKQMNVAADEFVVYAGKCFLPDETLLLNNITFKKIPRDIIKY